jgi:pyruvate dehydrogenase E1 component
MRNIATENVADLESIETQEWLESLDYVLQSNGPARAGQLLQELAAHARRRGIRLPFSANTPYVNTVTTDQESPFPGSPELERKIKSLVRWNAIAMVVRANKGRAGHRRPHFDVCVGRHVV